MKFWFARCSFCFPGSPSHRFFILHAFRKTRLGKRGTLAYDFSCMKYPMVRCVVVSFLSAAIICFSGCKPKGTGSDRGGTDETIKGPATVAQAARVLDLSTFPLMEGAAPNPQREVASLSYAVPGKAKAAYDFYRQKLTAQKWKESRDSSLTDQTVSGTFTRNGFVVSVSTYPGGDGGKLAVFIRNLGNVNLSKLPRPGGTKAVYAGDSAAMYVTESAVAATKEACRKLLLSDGWQPYGEAGDTQWFKQNAVRISATVSSAPAQGGKTMISFGSEMLSADLPAPDNAEDLSYAEATKELSFETAAGKDAMIDFYKKKLAQAAWEPTLEKTVDIDEKPTMIFRNPGKDMLTLSFSSERRDRTPVSLQYQSAAEIAELDRQLKEKAPQLRAEMERRQAQEAKEFAEAHKPLPKVAVAMPAGASGVEQSATEIKFTIGKGQAKEVTAAWRKQFHEAGWKEDVAAMESMAGAVSLSKDKESLTIHYTDTGFMPAEVTISAIGVELEPAEAKD